MTELRRGEWWSNGGAGRQIGHTASDRRGRDDHRDDDTELPKRAEAEDGR
ncbi:MAG: hypothetical protein J07HX64_02483 [halophilic archaeon J07HX64]|nr:MAG: hypothetical protein J07HX64_02483 [halophilic archaeon J07HX64]